MRVAEDQRYSELKGSEMSIIGIFSVDRIGDRSIPLILLMIEKENSNYFKHAMADDI